MSSALQGRIASSLRILIADTNRWALSPRLALDLTGVGCEVFAACPRRGHGLRKTSVMRGLYPLGAVRPLHDLEAAIRAVDPDLIIPACDRSVLFLHQLHARAAEGSKLRTLIERSLGAASSFAIARSRVALIETAAEAGIATPFTALITDVDAIPAIERAAPYPWVVKADGTWGGSGVQVVASREEAMAASERLRGLFRFSRALKRLLVNRDAFWTYACRHGVRPAISMQSFVAGSPANCVAACWSGKLLALTAVHVMSTAGDTGPAGIVQLVENSEMRAAAERLAERLQLSGYFGLDFIEREDGSVCLIEMNPRPAPPCFLHLGSGRDLGAALVAAATEQPMIAREAMTRAKTIVYLPESANPERAFAETWYRDVPTGEERLVEELRRPFPDRTLLFRFVQWWSSRSAAPAANPVETVENEVFSKK
jgi:predicted ATP-grasp superfamily ATP-dependent carboligase